MERALILPDWGPYVPYKPSKRGPLLKAVGGPLKYGALGASNFNNEGAYALNPFKKERS